MKLMAFYGYRPIGKEHHKNVFEFLREVKIDESLVNYFNKVRVRRNEFLYRDVASTSENEAQEIIKKAESFVSKIRTNVRENRTKIKDF